MKKLTCYEIKSAVPWRKCFTPLVKVIFLGVKGSDLAHFKSFDFLLLKKIERTHRPTPFIKVLTSALFSSVQLSENCNHLDSSLVSPAQCLLIPTIKARSHDAIKCVISDMSLKWKRCKFILEFSQSLYSLEIYFEK